LDKVEGKYKDRITKDLNDKIMMLEKIRDNYNFNDIDKLTCLNTHGDYNVLQFIYKEEKINAIIDFVSACKMPIVWEVIRSYTYIDKACKDGEINIDNLKDYVEEFNEYIKLNEYDFKYLSVLYLIQILNSDYGYKQYINDNSKTELLEFGFFRTNLCRNLYENNSKIEKMLIKNIKTK